MLTPDGCVVPKTAAQMLGGTAAGAADPLVEIRAFPAAALTCGAIGWEVIDVVVEERVEPIIEHGVKVTGHQVCKTAIVIAGRRVSEVCDLLSFRLDKAREAQLDAELAQRGAEHQLKQANKRIEAGEREIASAHGEAEDARARVEQMRGDMDGQSTAVSEARHKLEAVRRYIGDRAYDEAMAEQGEGA